MKWQLATIRKIIQENPQVKTFSLALPTWIPHLAGQHYDIRLTAPDGYQAQRSYSIASPPEQSGEIELTIELIDDGEVSGYLHEYAEVGDQLELRGPIGGYFVWEATEDVGPLLLIAGGSGIVPLMSMLRHRRIAKATHLTKLLFSIRSPQHHIYFEELAELQGNDHQVDLHYTYTRQAPEDWQGYQRRIDRAMLAELVSDFPAPPLSYICGPTALVEQVANLLVELGLSPERIKTERFGPTGG